MRVIAALQTSGQPLEGEALTRLRAEHETESALARRIKEILGS